jgi:glucose repression regulatory protein TUP1
MNHGYPPRGVVPPTAGPSQRLNELLDSVRAEFENESQRSVEYESTSEYSDPISAGRTLCDK